MADKKKFIRIILASIIFCSFGAMFMPFFTPILMAALFAFALDPLVARYSPKRSARRLPIALVLMFFFLVTALPIGFLGYQLTTTAKNISQTGLNNLSLFKSLQHLLEVATESFDRALLSMHIDPPAIANQSEIIGKIGTWFASATATIVSQAPQMILSLFIFSASLCYFLSESKNIRSFIVRLSIVTKSELDQIIHVVQRSSYITLVAHAIIGSAQATIVALGGLLFGYNDFFLLFVITFCCSLIPVLGASPIAILLMLFSLAQNDIKSAIGLGVVAVIAGSIDNILKPFIVSHSGDEDLNPIIALVAIIGAVLVYGLPGLLLGPILTTLAFKIVPILFSENLAKNHLPDETENKSE